MIDNQRHSNMSTMSYNFKNSLGSNQNRFRQPLKGVTSNGIHKFDGAHNCAGIHAIDEIS